MALESIPIPDFWPDFDQEILLLLEYGEDEIDVFQESIGAQASPSFEPADYREVAEALSWVRYQYELPGLRFCEWGCGFGIVTGMASLMGMEAHGIEKDELLVDQAKKIQRLFGLTSTIHSGDFYKTDNTSNVFPDPVGFDLIYAYPWPKEALRLTQWFDKCARPGACLLVYHGFSDLSLHRKMDGSS